MIENEMSSICWEEPTCTYIKGNSEDGPECSCARYCKNGSKKDPEKHKVMVDVTLKLDSRFLDFYKKMAELQNISDENAPISELDIMASILVKTANNAYPEILKLVKVSS